jgi:hypothetical protein
MAELSDAQRRALDAIRAVGGGVTYHAGVYYAADTMLRFDTTTSLIRWGYLNLDGVRNVAELSVPVAARVLHYKLTERGQQAVATQPMPCVASSFISIDADPAHIGFFVIKHHHWSFDSGEREIDHLQPGEIAELHSVLGTWLDVYAAARCKQEAQETNQC